MNSIEIYLLLTAAIFSMICKQRSSRGDKVVETLREWNFNSTNKWEYFLEEKKHGPNIDYYINFLSYDMIS